MKRSFCFCVIFLTILHSSTTVVETEARPYIPNGTVSGMKPLTGLHTIGHAATKAVLTINSFKKGGDGGGPSECDGQYHSDDELVVALSTGWLRGRCHKHIKITSSGHSVVALVVDECDSSRGCRNNIVDGSRAVWKALKVPQSQWGETEVYWKDA